MGIPMPLPARRGLADMTMPSGRSCSEATAGGAKKRISRSWGFDVARDGHSVHPFFEPPRA